MRARTADREATEVEGVLHLRYVPALNYVQVNLLKDGAVFDADPRSIQVLDPGVEPPERLEEVDPLRGDADWRPIRDLDAAQAAGLVPATRDYGGVTWADLFARGDKLVQPLVDAGWVVTERHAERTFGVPDSVMYSLNRMGELVDVERFEDDHVTVYPGGEMPYERDEDDVQEPLFAAKSDVETAAEFARRGWLKPRRSPKSGFEEDW